MDMRTVLRRNSAARAIREILEMLSETSSSPYKTIVKFMKELNLYYVIDVGANVGQFGLDIRRYGFSGPIISFEPVDASFRILERTAKKKQPWDVLHLALGSNESKKIINVSGNAGLSSSFLKASPTHLENFPESQTVGTQQIMVSTLDKQLRILEIDPGSLLLKIDVQGYEDKVLEGARKSLSKIPLCYLEISIVPLYEGEISLIDVLKILDSAGHQIIDLRRGVKAVDGTLLQIDVLTKLRVG